MYGMSGNPNGELWKSESRQAITRLAIELFVGGHGATRLEPDSRLLYFIILDASLSNAGISTSKIAAISGISRTTVRRKLQSLQTAQLIDDSPEGWRVTSSHLNRRNLRKWIARLEFLVSKTAATIKEPASSPSENA